MRLLWCCAAACVLFVITEASTLRPTQFQSTTQSNRRWRPQQQKDNSHLSSNKPEEIETTSARTRKSRISQEFVPKEITRTRTRKKPPETKESFDSEISQPNPQKEQNERYEPKKYSSIRSRTRQRNEEANKESSSPPSTPLRRTRPTFRRAPTQAPLDVSSPFIDERKIEIISSTFDDITKLPEVKSVTSRLTKQADVSSYQSTEKIQSKRRGRLFSRKSESNPIDLDGSGSTYSVAYSEKQPTTAKIIEDSKRGRKLRYKPQLTNNDKNAIGQGITISYEVKNSSQNNYNKIASQIESKITSPATVDGFEQLKDDDNKNETTNTNLKKVFKRPLTRGKFPFKPVSSIVKEKKVEEISDEDNYPASFKAMFHGKNASTQLDSPPKESLSVRASQRMDRTLTPLLPSTIDKETLVTQTLLQNRSVDVLDTEKENSTQVNSEIKSLTANDTESTNINLKRPVYRPRPVYVPKSRKLMNSSSSTRSSNTSTTTSNPVNKFRRRTKNIVSVKNENSTPDKSERIKASKKNVRSSYFTRRKSYTSNESSTSGNDLLQARSTKIASEKNINKYLPRTSYYTRYKNNKENVSESPKAKDEEVLQKDDVIASTEIANEATSAGNFVHDKEKKMIVIAVTSVDINENNSNDTIQASKNNSPRIEYIQISPSTKYHASYKKKDPSTTNPVAENSTPSLIPEIRNIKTRKQTWQRPKPNDYHDTEELSNAYQKKIGESFSKTTEASTNGIASEPENPKNRYSSKFRASYITDQPFYKPTVPSVSSSTAWLKFFVTDRELMKSVQEPMWFENFSGTTESLSRTITNANIPSSSSSPSITEPPPELVEGEESILGPDMNSISFTQTRSTLASEDLRLSESIMKPLHVMNVEASNHSPSVTISIFDALADILTSTPRPQTTPTTELTPHTTYIRHDVKQTIHGVSNNIDVNNDLVSQNTFISAFTKPVQFSDQTTPNVINSLEQSLASTSLEEQYNTSPVSITDPVPSTPYAPFSLRRPFAVKILYSDTESSTVKTTTSQPSSIQPTTDTVIMVQNPVSDLIPSNNLVSSELTSMLSSNIETLLKNLDKNTKARVSLDMARMLKNLIPRALNGMTNDNPDTPITTPYSLEDIKDTEVNINFDESNKIVSNNNVTDIFSSLFLQNITRDDSVQIDNKVSGVGGNVKPFVNIIVPAEFETTTESEPTSITSSDDLATFFEMTLSNIPVDGVTSSTTIVETTIMNQLLDSNVVNVSGISNPSSVDKTMVNQGFPLPFLANTKISDFTLSVTATNLDVEITTSSSANPLPVPLNIPIQPSPNDVELSNPSNGSPNQISPLQLLILSKKATVLKMIEDILIKHKEELATVTPMSETLVDNQPLSDRLTEILNGINTTTPDDKTLLSNLISLPMTTFTPDTIRPFTSMSIDAFPNESSMGTTQIIEPRSNFDSSEPAMTTPINPETLHNVSLRAFENQETNAGEFMATTKKESTGSTETATSTNLDTTLSSSETMNNEATTEFIVTSPMLPFNVNSSSEANESKTATQTIFGIESTVTSPSTNFIRKGPPKKDFVIFGILPNNTVVRKDPNEDALETLTEASPYIVYGVLPNNTIIRKFPNGTRVPRVMQKIDILPISPWSLRNPYSPIHNNPAIVRPQSNPIRLSTNAMTSTDNPNVEAENLTNDTVNKTPTMIISTSSLNLRHRSLNDGIATTNKPPTEKSTASHVLSLRTTTMLPSIDEILLNSLSSAAKEEMVISSMMSSTNEPRILTLDIDPETQQIRTEKPVDGNGNSIFKFIPIDEIKVAPQDSNVQKLATRSNVNPEVKITNQHSHTTQIPQNTISSDDTTTHQMTDTSYQVDIPTPITEPVTTYDNNIFTTMIQEQKTTEDTPLSTTTIYTPTRTEATNTFKSDTTTMKEIPTIPLLATTSQPSTTNFQDDLQKYQQDTLLLESLLQATNRVGKNLNVLSTHNNLATVYPPEFTTTARPTTTTVRQQNIDPANLRLLQALLMADSNKATAATVSTNTRTTDPTTTQADLNEDFKILQQLLLATGKKQLDPSVFQNSFPVTTPVSSTIRSLTTTTTTTSQPSTTMSPSLEDDIKKFKEDTLLLQALLKATGQNPANFNIPTFPNIESTTLNTTPRTTTTTKTTTTTTTQKPTTTTQNIQEDIKKLQEDSLFLQTLLQATGQNTNNINLPIVTGITSNVRVFSNHMTSSISSNPTTAVPIRPVYIPTTAPFINTNAPSTVWTQSSLNEDIGISTTHPPFDIQRNRMTTTTTKPESTTAYRRFQRPTTVFTARKVPERVSVTTDKPNTSTFSAEEDLAFLKNLKTVLNTNQVDDPETSLANRIIALAVEKSLTEIQGNRDGKAIQNNKINRVVTTLKPTTTTTTTTTRKQTTTVPTTKITPSIEEDLKQFEEDSKLLQALLKATGQNPDNFKIPTIMNAQSNVRISPTTTQAPEDNLRVLSNLLSSPSPFNTPSVIQQTTTTKTSTKPVNVNTRNNLRETQDDAKLLQTLIELQEAQDLTTTTRTKLAITGQTSNEALNKLLQQTKQTGGMVSEATKAPLTLSTEYGKSNDALLAALLKEQGFGPTTASSLDEQIKLAALLNQVVVTPKPRRVTTAAPQPAPRRPIMDGLAWLWQQWRETAPGTGPPRPRRPAPAQASTATSNRVSWFGSGPFTGNADDGSSNRVPLEPPSTSSNQAPARGQLVSAAINVTRAFSQFLGAAIQGAAQTVQSVIRAGQRATNEVYGNGSGR